MDGCRDGCVVPGIHREHHSETKKLPSIIVSVFYYIF